VHLAGVWIPLVTPFRDSRLDLPSLERLVEDLVPKGISGLIVGATTGESPVLSDEERAVLVRTVQQVARGRVPVLAGVGGPDTQRVIESVERVAEAGADGVLSICPYFSRPDQRGIVAHFRAIAASSPIPVVLYNNPSRTAVRMTNETIRRLAELENVVGLKDCSGDVIQSMELLLDPPPRLAILTGEDALFYPMLALGAAGGILAAAHWATESFVEVWNAARRNDHHAARRIWARLLPGARLLFEEPSPAPVKYLLAAAGRIASGEVRLPLVPPSEALKERIARLA
jgi:4-hydroxy-tetrahydrodipicolinate synthase